MTSGRDDRFRRYFGECVRETRKRQDRKQKEIAEKVGITQSYFSYIEKGMREVSLTLGLNIADELGLDVCEINRLSKMRKARVIRPECPPDWQLNTHEE